MSKATSLVVSNPQLPGHFRQTASTNGTMGLSILLVRALIEGVESHGVSREAFLHAAGLDRTTLERNDGRVSLDRYDALCDLARRMTNEPALGLRMGQLANATTHSVAAHMVAHAATLREAIDALTRYHRILTGRAVIRVEEQGDKATLSYDIAPGSLAARRFRAEVGTTGFYRMLRYFSRDAAPDYVAFEHAAPAYSNEYGNLFEGLQRYSQPFTGLVFDRAYMNLAQLNADAEFNTMLRAQAEKQLLRLEREASYAERIRDLVLNSQTSSRRDMESAARALGLSARSLRRKLQLEGASYADVVDEALAVLAKRLLADEARSIEETAYALGFSAPSAFHKAFKRWTGLTPADFRRRPTSEPPPSGPRSSE